MPRLPYFPMELAAFRGLQRLAYELVEKVDAGLREGLTERDVVALMAARFAERGISELSRAPSAWFGARTAFSSIRGRRDLRPTELSLRPGMPVILAVAPVFQGYACDLAYTTSFGANAALARAKVAVAALRPLVLEHVRRERTLEEIHEAIEREIAGLRYAGVRGRRPFRALVQKLTLRPRRFGVLARLTHRPDAAAPLESGLWVVGPHIARDGVGAMWRELLLVTDSGARWLDDDLPHVRNASMS